jgi:cytochrome c-type biogenesis protein CcmH/NrfG
VNETTKYRLLPLTLLLGVVLFAPALFAKTNGTLDQAREAARHSEWEQAATLAQKAVQEDAGDEDAWSLLGEAQFTLGDTSQAVQSFEKAVGINPKQPAPVLALTRYYLRKEDVPNAERVVAAAEERDPKGKIDEIKVARGMIFASQNNMAEATKALASATAKNPKNPLYPQILAGIYEDKGVYDLAEQYYADAWKLDPGNAGLAYEYGLVLQHQKKYDEALNLFKQVQEKDPNNKSVDYLIGRLYFAARRYAEAATQLEKSVAKRPDHFLSHYLLGRSYLEFSKSQKQNRYGDAVRELRRALELRPGHAETKAALEEALATEGLYYYQLALSDTTGSQRARLDSSIEFSHEALAVDSTNAQANGQLARAWFKIGNYDSSAVYSRNQLALTPNDDAEFGRLISSLQHKKDNAALVGVLRPRFESMNWTTPRVAGDSLSTIRDRFLDKFGGAYANALLETGNASGARETMKTMLTYKPDWCDGHGLYAYMYLKAERYQEAVGALQAAVKNCPTNGDLWLSLGDSYYFSNPKDKDNVQKAKNAYQRAMNLGNSDAREKYNQLNK